MLLLFLPLSLACLPLFIIGLMIWGRPPIISPLSRFYRYFTATWTEGKPEEGIPLTNRILIFLCILDFVVKSPIKGVAWFLDEVFYSSYRKCEIKNPLFFISARRSGSTQLADYLEDDNENFLAPMVIEALFPYIWAWRMIAPILKIIGLKFFKDASSNFYGGEEMKKRHNSSLFKTDSLDLPIGLIHMIDFSGNLGISFLKWGIVSSALKEQPVDSEFCKIFIELNDCIIKKVMFHRGLPNQQIFVKSHMLIVARELEQRYNGAKFLTVVRDPIGRFRSHMNFIKVRSVGLVKGQFGLFPITWRVVRDYVIESQICYCEDEMMFYNQSEENAKNKLVVSFDMYVKNLAATLQCVYSFLNIPMSSELLSKAAALQKSSHDRTKRKMEYDPKYNRSLSSLGVDEKKLNEYLSDYINWMKRLG